MLPQYYRQQRPVRSGPMRVAEVGKGDYYLTRENSPYSLALDDGLAGFSIKKAFSSVTKPFSSAVSGAFRFGAKAATGITKVVTAPTRGLVRLYADSGLPGSRVVGSTIQRTLNTMVQAPGSAVLLTETAARTPFIVARGVTTGEMGRALQQVEKEVRVAGGEPLKLAVKAAPFALTIGGMPYLAAALAAATAARSAYLANRANKLAQAQAEGAMRDAYQTYVDEVGKVGKTPVDFSVFSGWVNAGGQGEIPLGPDKAQAGSSDGTYPTAPVSQDGSIVPLIIIGAAAALGEAPSVAPIVNPPAPPQSTSIVPWLMLGIAILKK